MSLRMSMCSSTEHGIAQAKNQKLTSISFLSQPSTAIFDGREHRKLYIPGVGRKPKAEAKVLEEADYDRELARLLNQEFSIGTASISRSALGGAFGKGTAARIRGAYHFISKNFDRNRADKLFLFGFSRGAFAARSLAGFIGYVGLLLADKLDKVEEAYELYEGSQDPSQSKLSEFLYELTGFRTASEQEQLYISTHFLGVWDTVASLGLPSRLEWFTAPFTEHHETDTPPAVLTARHALALHEVRDPFEPLFFKQDGSRDIREVWFTGAHADVGGGYEIGKDGLSNIALRWMAGEARENGLLLESSPPWVGNSNESLEVHHEIRGKLAWLIPTPRDWLINGDVMGRYFHCSAVNYLLDGDTRTYNFKHYWVNKILKQIDSQASTKAWESIIVNGRAEQ